MGQECEGRGQVLEVLGGGEQAVESRREPVPEQGQAPLSHQTSLTKHKFKHKTKDFKTAKPERKTSTKCSGHRPKKPSLINKKRKPKACGPVLTSKAYVLKLDKRH